MSGKPLLISDCDEVLLHMVVPFQGWLDEAHDISFDLDSGTFVDALRHKESGDVVQGDKVWELLNGFFDGEMHRQGPIAGAVESINRLSEIADVVILTNLMDHRNERRKEQLKEVGIDFPVFTNQGGKGEAMLNILEEYKPSVAAFIDDLDHQHSSIAEHAPDIWRLHFVGEPIIARHIKPSPTAHARIDDWAGAEEWLRSKLIAGETAPKLAKEEA